MVFPELDITLDSSALLRANVDERGVRVWDYDRDGEFLRRGAEKDDFDRLVGELVAGVAEEELRELARGDPPLLRGSTMRGPYRFDPDTDDLHVVAVRQLELALHRARSRLHDLAYLPASPEDRVCATVVGLYESLSSRDRLLTLTPEMVRDERGFHDRVFCLGEYAVFPHPALRPARELVQELCWMAGEGVEVQVAIDPHAVIARDAIQDVGLFDYWWGLELRLADLDDPSKTGVTIHARRPDAQDEYFFPLLRTEFRWSSEGPIKTLEVQETVPSPSRETDRSYVENRYLHSRRDTGTRSFVHLDGAVKAFPCGAYGPTVEQPDLPQGEPVYRKLFRLDGEIDDRDWGRLVAHFFRENELVIEYFGDVLDERPRAASA
jgi:hypothetical protein